MRTACFKAMDGDYKIADLKVFGAAGAGGDKVQKVGADGKWGQEYFFISEDVMPWALAGTGWYYDSFGETPVTDDDVITTGEALFFSADSDFDVQSSGEVYKGQPTASIPAGSSMIGNPQPVEIKISGIELEGVAGAGGDKAQLVSADGSWGTEFFYITEDSMPWAAAGSGWYFDSFGETPVTDDNTLKPGEAMFFSLDSDATVTFPKVLD